MTDGSKKKKEEGDGFKRVSNSPQRKIEIKIDKRYSSTPQRTKRLSFKRIADALFHGHHNFPS